MLKGHLPRVIYRRVYSVYADDGDRASTYAVVLLLLLVLLVTTLVTTLVNTLVTTLVTALVTALGTALVTALVTARVPTGPRRTRWCCSSSS